jgi:hypothetical protein
MKNGSAATVEGGVESVIRDCATLLRAAASYRLPKGLDQRLLWLSENKEALTQAEREELEALVDLAEERTLEKVQARVALRRLAEAFPQVVSSS